MRNGPSSWRQSQWISLPSGNPVGYRRFAVQRRTGSDSRAGGDQQNAGPDRQVIERLLECRGERGGMHLLVLGDDNTLGSYTELPRERGTVSAPRRRGDDDIDVGQRQRGVAQAVA